VIPFDCTVVGYAVRARDGNAAKNFDIEVNGSSIHSFSLSALQSINTTLDINASAGSLLSFFADAAGGAALDVVADVFIRWRS